MNGSTCKSGVGRYIPGVLLFCVLMCVSVSAQSGTSSIHGKVVDAQGKIVAGATVTLTDIEKGSTRTQSTTENGEYNFTPVTPGKYKVDAESKGFKKASVTDVNALIDTPTTVDVKLEVGNVDETVTVTAGASEALINTQDATLGNTFGQVQINQLPLNSRNVTNLLSLQPAVTQTGEVAGGRNDQSNITIDGVDANEQQTGAAFSPVLRVTPDSVQEFRVTITNPTATQGRSSGAQVSLLTRSGTNQFHGGLYEFLRNTDFNANNWFNNRSHVPTPVLNRSVFGGSVGGPIVKDRAFFFYNYEGLRDITGASVVRTVPLASLGAGQVRYQATINGSPTIVTLNTADMNALFPDVKENPVALSALAAAAAKYPANDFTVGDSKPNQLMNTAGFRFNAPISSNNNVNTARFDFNLDSRQTVFARGIFQYDLGGAAPQFPDTPSPNTWSHPYGIAFGHTWTISPTKINRFIYGLTREAFSSQGDSNQNAISFRFVFSPLTFSRTLSRTTPVHNIADDFSWLRGNHQLQMGANIRLISNNRVSFSSAFDNAITNPSFYDLSGAVLTNPLPNISGNTDAAAAAVAAVIGRFSQYTSNFNFGQNGSVLPSGTGVARTFATQEYEGYFQDTWQFRPNLTFTLGLRYGVNTPVYETNGFEVTPTTSLSDYFNQRVASAAKGVPFNAPITVDLAGPVNNKPGFYSTKWNNFMPRVAFAWQPKYREGLLGKIFSEDSNSVIRGGFSQSYDRIGSALAVSFDLNNTLGFSSSTTISANTYNVTDRPAPLFTGFGQDVRTLPGITPPSKLVFPLQQPSDEEQRIEQSLDDKLTSPVNYSWNFSYERKLPGGFVMTASYIGRAARHLLATRDIMALNDLVDPKSGTDWFTAANKLFDLRLANTPILSVQPIPYFENLFPTFTRQLNGVTLTPTQRAYRFIARQFVNDDSKQGSIGGLNDPDWTTLQASLNDFYVGGVPAFFQPQYGALSTFSTIASSTYHGATLTIRRRLKDQLFFDFNYTFAKSIDNASGNQQSGAFGAAFILNALAPGDNRAASDFDFRHIVNSNVLWQIPIGKGQRFLNDAPGVVNAIIGGWQLGTILRWNSGLPVSAPFDSNIWATNWNVQSNGTLIRPLTATPTKQDVNGDPNLFNDPTFAFQSFRNARPGETGQRNIFRLPGFFTMDASLDKKIHITEKHTIQFRWEVFNVTNTQILGALAGGRAGFGLAIDPQLTPPGSTFGNFSGIQGTPRIMQFALRYDF